MAIAVLVVPHQIALANSYIPTASLITKYQPVFMLSELLYSSSENLQLRTSKCNYR